MKIYNNLSNLNMSNPNRVPGLYHNQSSAIRAAQNSPFMNLYQSSILARPFPSFDHVFSKPAGQSNEFSYIYNEQQQMNQKIQILEEKLRISEAKQNMLESINKLIINDDPNKIYQNHNNEIENNNLNNNTLNILKGIQEDLYKKQCILLFKYSRKLYQS